jgi:ribonuclease VapC
VTVIADASAVLAVLQGEVDGAVLADEDVVVGAVNLTEVVGKLAERGMPAEEIQQVLATLDLRVDPFGEDDAHRTGLLRQQTREHGLSLADRACIALALKRLLPVLTADREWGSLDVERLEVRLIR